MSLINKHLITVLTVSFLFQSYTIAGTFAELEAKSYKPSKLCVKHELREELKCQNVALKPAEKVDAIIEKLSSEPNRQKLIRELESLLTLIDTARTTAQYDTREHHISQNMDRIHARVRKLKEKLNEELIHPEHPQFKKEVEKIGRDIVDSVNPRVALQ